MPTREEFLRGLLRGLTSDVVGGPVDLAETVANLGIAGGGYLGHKMGLLSQPPELLEASPGTSEWWARKAGNPDKGSGAYTAGRVIPGLAGMAAGLVPKPVPGKLNALFPGGDPELLLSHASYTEGLRRVMAGGRAPELYSPSFAVTRKGLATSFAPPLTDGRVYLIPREGAFDPASYPSTLFNRDAYTSRHENFSGRVAAKALEPREMWASNAYSNPRGLLKALRRGDLSGMDPLDEMAPVSRALEALPHEYYKSLFLAYDPNKGGWPPINKILSQDRIDALQGVDLDKMLGRIESYYNTGRIKRPPSFEDRRLAAQWRLSDRLDDPAMHRMGESQLTGTHGLVVATSPAFRSFISYEKDRRGAKTLLEATEENKAKPERYAHSAARVISGRLGGKDLPLDTDEVANLAHEVLRNKNPLLQGTPEERYVSGLLSFRGKDRLETFLEPEEGVQELRGLVRMMSEAPSDYAELKVMGPVPITRENFAGALLTPDVPERKKNLKYGRSTLQDDDEGFADALSRYLPVVTSPGDPYYYGDNAYNKALFDLAQELQRQAGPARRTPLK